jgi:hypothetical protein
MPNPIVLDLTNTREYLSNPWHKKYGLGLFFTPLQDANIEIVIDIITINKGQEKHYKCYHALHDGYSALHQLSQEEGINLNFQEPVIRHSRNKIRSIFSALFSNPKFCHQLPSQREYTSAVCGRWFTLKIKQHHTSFILNKLNQIFLNHLTTNDRARWMIPCRISNELGLQASYIAMVVKKNETVEHTRQNYKQKLILGEQWGFYYLACALLKFGKWAIKLGSIATLRRDRTLWLGSLSNLGNLGSSADIEQLIINHPVRWQRPVGVITYSFNSDYYLTIGFHESLQDYDLAKIVKEVTDEL